MTPRISLDHEFVEFIPRDLQDGRVYVSIVYATAAHRCACGCGNKVVTPITPTDWRLTFDGETISLYPSIGNWSFPCRSHYWIRENRVEWAGRWSRQEVEAGRARDRACKDAYFQEPPISEDRGASSAGAGSAGVRSRLRAALRWAWRALRK